MPETDKQNKIKLQKEIEILKQQLEQAQTGIENIKKMLNNILINQPKYTRSVFLKVFFDAKNGELIEIFRKENDPEIFELLRKIDPAHISKYNEATSN